MSMFGVRQFGVLTSVGGSSIDLFHSSLENNPPVPTLQTGHNPLHRFLGFNPRNHLLSMSARDPNDSREMPPNGHAHMSVYTLRGVRKVRQFFSTSDCELILSLAVSVRLAFTCSRMSA